MKIIKLTVWLLTFNHQEYLRQCLDSVVMQVTNFNFRILVNDDCSTDGSREIIDAYQRDYGDLIVPIYEASNQFHNKTIFERFGNLTSSEYVAYVEGDDYWTDKHKIQKQVDYMDAHPGVVLTFHDALALHGSQLKSISGVCRRNLTASELKSAPPISTLTICFRNILDNVTPLYRYAKTGDLFLWSLFGYYGEAHYLRSIAPSIYRHHSRGINSMVNNAVQRTNAFQTHLLISAFHLDYLDQNDKTPPENLQGLILLSLKIYGPKFFYRVFLLIVSDFFHFSKRSASTVASKLIPK